MLEVYNEEIKDLLGKGPPAGTSSVWTLPCSLLCLLSTTEFKGGLRRAGGVRRLGAGERR